MKAVKQATSIIVLTLFLGGCASTRITSQADLTATMAPLDTLMVIAAFDDLDMRRLGEREMRERFASHGVVCVPSSELFFPGNSYGEKDVRGKLSERHIDAILVISSYGAGSTEEYVPPTYYTRGSAWVSGSSVSGNSTTYTTGGYTRRYPWAKFRAEMIDVRTERSTWVATARSGGNAYASGHTLLRSFCGRVMNRLVTDGVVRPLNATAH